jgi:hypothetical protein
MTTVTKSRWYPSPAPCLEGEDDDTYTNRLIGALGDGLRPYDHARNRQCSIGYHTECSCWRGGTGCECPCHEDPAPGALRISLTLGAARLAALYDLPEATGLRVMALTSDAAGGGPDPSREDVAEKLNGAYRCEQGGHFITDVLAVYRAAVNGTLR